MFASAKEEKKEVKETQAIATVALDTVTSETKEANISTAVTVETSVQKTEIEVTAVPLYKASDYPESTFTINSVKVIFAKEGTSLLALANNYKISYKKLLEFNDMDEAKTTDILGYDQLIFLGKKGKKGSKELHIVDVNETLEIIAQKEGVQLESLLAFNRIPKGKQPKVGEKIYLKTNSPVTPKLVESTATK
jgi:hypothetical protein